ncbi:MAG: right-handed parallel beta-helix repeat-containing protein [Clostridia bacterium]|nr:right-handed parallel beta-helix repeat-containing protein [Clostridia bacterium]
MCAKQFDKPAAGANTAEWFNRVPGMFDAEADALREKILNTVTEPNVAGDHWYVSESGNDEADGKTPATAWQTLKGLAAHAADIKAGDAVLFERGGVYRGTIRAISGVYYGAYGEGDKPCIYGSHRNLAETPWEKSAIENVWYTTGFHIDVGHVVFDHGKEVGLKMRYSLRECCHNGDFFYKDGVLYLYMDKGNPADLYDSIEAGERDVVISISENHDVTIDNLCIKYGGGHGIQGGGTKNIAIINCEMGWIGGSFLSKDVRYGNAIEFWADCDGVLVDNCWIYQCYDTGFTFQSSCGGPERNIKMLNCLLEYNWYSTEMWNGHGTDNTQDNIEFSNNIMRFAGYGWGKQRPDQVNSSHMFGGRQMTNFVAKNNIFERGVQSLLCCFQSTFEGNTFVQEKRSGDTSLGPALGDVRLAFDDNAAQSIATHLGDTNAKIYYID